MKAVLVMASILWFSGNLWAGEKEAVIVLHGIARSSSSMDSVAEFLEQKGYAVHNIDYPSTQHTIEKLVDWVHGKIEEKKIDPQRRTHFVAYSLGSLITRGLIHKYRPKNLGRVVMLGPPNKGSEVADWLHDNFLYSWVYGPAGQELGSKRDGYSDMLGKVDFELGIIAGDRSIDPLSSAIIPGPDDGKVAIQSTRLQGMTDHLVVHTSHTFMILNDEVFRQTWHFLKHGRFDRKVGP